MLIRDLPFVWRLNDTPDALRPAGVPARMDFQWDWDPAIGLLKQKVTPELRTALKAIYARGSENLGATQSYGTAFWDWLQPYLKGRLTALEVGPGKGWLLGKLRDAGIVATGCDKFPAEALDLRYDLIVHHHVLEHVEDPVAFLIACRERLNPGGIVVCAVPDCTESIALGDISMACHQHVSYFSVDSLHQAAHEAGFKAAQIMGDGGTLMMIAWTPAYATERGSNPQTFGAFICKAAAARESVSRVWGEFYHAQQVFGYYVPMRALPYFDMKDPDDRLYDDSMAGKYLDGVPSPMEAFSADAPLGLCPGLVFIMSLTHESAIRNRIGNRCKVITLREMLTA